MVHFVCNNQLEINRELILCNFENSSYSDTMNKDDDKKTEPSKEAIQWPKVDTTKTEDRTADGGGTKK